MTRNPRASDYFLHILTKILAFDFTLAFGTLLVLFFLFLLFYLKPENFGSRIAVYFFLEIFIKFVLTYLARRLLVTI